MRNIFRGLRPKAAVLALLIFGGLAIPAGGLVSPTAADANTCALYRCEGVDPNAAACTGNSTVARLNNIEYRLSSTCKAMWARHLNPGSPPDHFQIYCIYSGPTRTSLDTNNMEHFHQFGIVDRQCRQLNLHGWTNMTYGKYNRICIHPAGRFPDSALDQCTGYSSMVINPYHP